MGLLSKRIYPIPVKPASGIVMWSGWPEDVQPVLREWNRSRVRRLSFGRIGVFKCWGCEKFCKSATNGAAVLDGNPYCDDCLVDVAREQAS